MTKYKALKSVAQDLGRSFLSDTNTVDSGKSHVPQTLFDLACSHALPRIQIDFFTGTITPTAFAVSDVLKSITMYRRALPRLVESRGASWDTVRGAGLELVFELPKNGRADADRVPATPSFKCSVRILDDRGVNHVGRPTNWCR
ncbi:MAG: hypothetical protein AB7T31_06355 [Gemmatimonadales bacterium]